MTEPDRALQRPATGFGRASGRLRMTAAAPGDAAGVRARVTCASPHAAAFAPYVPAPEYSAPPVYPAPQSVTRRTRPPSTRRPTTRRPHRCRRPARCRPAGAARLVRAAGAPERADARCRSRSWEDLLAERQPSRRTPAPAGRAAAAPTPTAVCPPLPRRSTTCRRRPLASAPPPTVEPDLEWLREPVPTGDRTPWSLDGDDDGRGRRSRPT